VTSASRPARSALAPSAEVTRKLKDSAPLHIRNSPILAQARGDGDGIRALLSRCRVVVRSLLIVCKASVPFVALGRPTGPRRKRARDGGPRPCEIEALAGEDLSIPKNGSF
jgi:hypothetical protein